MFFFVKNLTNIIIMKILKFYNILAALSLFLIFQQGFSQNNTQEMEEMLQLVNELRAQEGLQPLQLNTSLNNAAFNHSKDMGDNNYFSHTGLNGSSFSDRARAEGYTGSPRGENIAAGNATVEATFRQWVNSGGHLNNMLNAGHNEMGIGHATVDGSRYTHYWTQIFGKGNLLSVTSFDKNEIAVTVYPNPFSDEIQCKISQPMTDPVAIRIIDSSGKVVYEDTKAMISESYRIASEQFSSGLYFVLINDGLSKKIVKL